MNTRGILALTASGAFALIWHWIASQYAIPEYVQFAGGVVIGIFVTLFVMRVTR